jgi:hypothetical protein
MKADYAPYLTNAYTNNGHTYSATAPDPQGNKLAGLYGAISPSGLADWGRMKQVLQWHGLNTAYVSPTWDGVVAALKRGHPVILGNDLTAAGHIIVAIGYTSNQQLIVNDPYGNRFTSGYGANDGQAVYYAWNCSRVRNALEVIGTVPTPTDTPTITPTATTTEIATATAHPQSASVLEVDATRIVGAGIGLLSENADTNFGRNLNVQPLPSPTARAGADTKSPSKFLAPGLRVLAAHESAPRPTYWLLIFPTLLGLAAFVIMYIDWRKRRRAAP